MHMVRSKQLSIALSDKGEFTAISFGSKKVERVVSGLTHLAGCVVKDIDVAKLSGGGMKFTKILFHEKGEHDLTLVEQFVPTATSIRWEIEIKDDGKPWSTPVQTRLQYPVTQSVRFWAAWADPRHEIAGRMNKEQLIASGIVPGVNAGGNWADPLVPVAIGNARFWYGAPPYRYHKTGVGFHPGRKEGKQVLCMPFATLIETDADLGLSLVLSPEDLLLDMSLTTTEEGKITFTRFFHRLGQGKPVRFALDLVVHEADWRAALGWMAWRYREFFDPPNPKADRIAGTGAYSSQEAEFDAEKMRGMAFMVKWKACFDLPYMGMFLPPVDGDHVAWRRYGGGTVTIGKMREYSRKMREMGFHVLSYFNVSEFGAKVASPAPVRKVKSDADLWKNCNDFLYAKLADAIVLTPEGENRPGFPYWTWGRAVVMDPGEPVYQEYLLAQAWRHIEKLPETSGFCIDRMDWLRLYNHRRDDGVS